MMYGISLNKDGTTKVVAQRLDHTTSIESDARLEGEVTTEVPDAADEAATRSPRHRSTCRKLSRSASLRPCGTSRIFTALAVLAVVAFFVLKGRERDEMRDLRSKTPNTGPGHVRDPLPDHAAKQKHAPAPHETGAFGRRVPQGRLGRQGQGAVQQGGCRRRRRGRNSRTC